MRVSRSRACSAGTWASRWGENLPSIERRPSAEETRKQGRRGKDAETLTKPRKRAPRRSIANAVAIVTPTAKFRQGQHALLIATSFSPKAENRNALSPRGGGRGT